MTKSESSTPCLGNLAPFSSCMAMFSYGNASKRWGVAHGISSWYICILKLVMIVLIDLPKAQQALLVNNYPGLSIRGLPTLSLGDLIRRMYGSQKIICRTILKSKAKHFLVPNHHHQDWELSCPEIGGEAIKQFNRSGHCSTENKHHRSHSHEFASPVSLLARHLWICTLSPSALWRCL